MRLAKGTKARLCCEGRAHTFVLHAPFEFHDNDLAGQLIEERLWVNRDSLQATVPMVSRREVCKPSMNFVTENLQVLTWAQQGPLPPTPLILLSAPLFTVCQRGG